MLTEIEEKILDLAWSNKHEINVFLSNGNVYTGYINKVLYGEDIELGFTRTHDPENPVLDIFALSEINHFLVGTVIVVPEH